MPKMKLNAVSVTSRDMAATVKFYTLLGFEFPAFKPDEDHLEPLTKDGEVRLMIDSVKLMKQLLGTTPKPPNHASFAMLCAAPSEVDSAVAAIKQAGFTVIKEPWDAFWGQRYATVADPDGYMVDLFAWLKEEK